MTHHGRRSHRAREKRLARRVVQNAAWRDSELAETINVLTPEQIAILTMKREGVDGLSVHVGSRYVKGEVISDNRARGTHQRIPWPKSQEKLFYRMWQLNEEIRFARLERSRAAAEPNGGE